MIVTENGSLQTQWREWLTVQALPLWSGAGFDPARGLYHERLTWDGQPSATGGALRLMVQARQVATFCRAALDHVHDASHEALMCLDALERLYYRRDSQPGWIFSLNPDNQPASTTRDLYAHAFILFAYGWAIRLSDEPRYRQLARRTAEEIGTIFFFDNQGYYDAIPPVDQLRRQNPHMHLLESYLLLLEVTKDEFYLTQARSLVKLALNHLIDSRSGLLLEFFNSDWSPAQAVGQNRVEPGHLFEWVWLLYEYERLAAPGTTEAALLTQARDRLFRAGLSLGCDPLTGLVHDAMTEDGTIIERSTRIWPQTELLRILCSRRGFTESDMISADQIGTRFLKTYAPARLNGGWIDRLDATGAPSVDHMPASSLYHIYGAACELLKMKAQ